MSEFSYTPPPVSKCQHGLDPPPTHNSDDIYGSFLTLQKLKVSTTKWEHFFLSWGNLTDQVSWSVYKFNVTWREWRDVTWRDVSDATLFTRSPIFELFWNFWIIWVSCPGSYNSWTNFYARWKNTIPKKKKDSLFTKGRLWLRYFLIVFLIPIKSRC